MENGVYKQAVPEEGAPSRAVPLDCARPTNRLTSVRARPPTELSSCATAEDDVVDADAKTLLMWQMAQMECDGYD
eukprot:6776686-Prymnesium_polylepis.1